MGQDKESNSLEAQYLAHMGAAARLSGPAAPQTALMLATPHSGRIYFQPWVDSLKQPLRMVRQTEDAFVDDLLSGAIDNGIACLSANFPRSFVDVNRARNELPESLGGPVETTRRVEAGLGVIPTAVSQFKALYNELPDLGAVERRLTFFYDAYHQALSQKLKDTYSAFGQAVLLDMHSMPGKMSGQSKLADFVLGDRFGRSCRSDIVSLTSKILQRQGYKVGYNHPYAGGYITEHYGHPDDGISVLQIEINRDLYLNPITLTRKKSFKKLSADLTALCAELKSYLAEKRDIRPLAAE